MRALVRYKRTQAEQLPLALDSVRPVSDTENLLTLADMELTAEERRQAEEQMEQLLSGQGSEVSGCDVGLDQSKPATLRKNVTYIVCAVIFNDTVT